MLDYDSECSVDSTDIAAEQAGGAAMMLQHATYWDDFLEYMDANHAPWAEGDDDTDDYRKGRAVEQFNNGCLTPSNLQSTLAMPPLPPLFTCACGSRTSRTQLEGAEADGQELGPARDGVRGAATDLAAGLASQAVS